MNYCMNKNLWLLLDSNDPADELLWLIFELQLAELKGEKVLSPLHSTASVGALPFVLRIGISHWSLLVCHKLLVTKALGTADLSL